MKKALLSGSLVVAIVVVALWDVSARASDPNPSIADMRSALERGEAREALRLNTSALRLRGDAARGYDPYELLMVRGEALMAVGLPLEAENAYEHAVPVAKGLKERAAAHAEGLLARQAAKRVARAAEGGAAAQGARPDPRQAATRCQPPPTPEARRRAMRELYEALLPSAEAKVHAAVGGKTLPPVYGVLTPLIDLGSLELTADGTLEKSYALLQELGEWASGVITEQLRRLESEVSTLGAAAAEVEPSVDGGHTARWGLNIADRKVLEEVKVTLFRLEEVTREGRRLAEILNDRVAFEVWQELSVKASNLYARVESRLGRRY